MRSFSLATLIAVSLCSLTSPRTADACGGCFHEPPGPNEPPMTSVVTGHRMALSVSPDQTVLWDQVQFTGDPSAFAWVLPVGPGATVELSNDAWFDALEGVTRTTIESEVVTCPNGQSFGGGSSGGFGCGASAVDTSDESAGFGGEGGGGGGLSEGRNKGAVTVVHQGTIGPYETVTLKANDALNLRKWLTSHNYSIPADIDPVLADYISEGAEFIALRLQPGAGVRQMRPVRVVTQGASPILPLRMVQAGTGATTSIVLYVISEGRYRAANFAEAALPLGDLTWDWTTQSSNHAALRDEALVSGGFLTSFARTRPFSSPILTPEGIAAQYQAPGQLPVTTLADLYTSVGASLGVDVGSCPSTSGPFASTEKVLAACDNGACSGAPIAADFACGALDDIGVALTGLHPNDVFLTRLEANLPRSLLTKDLILAPSDTQSPVANWLVAPNNVNRPSCPAPQAGTQPAPTPNGTGCGCSIPVPSRRRAAGLSMVVVALAAFARRSFSRRSRRGRSD